MSGLDLGRIHHRIKGRQVIERSTRLLLIRAHRVLRGRRLADADAAWLRRLIDRLTEALQLDNHEARR